MTTCSNCGTVVPNQEALKTHRDICLSARETKRCVSCGAYVTPIQDELSWECPYCGAEWWNNHDDMLKGMEELRPTRTEWR